MRPSSGLRGVLAIAAVGVLAVTGCGQTARDGGQAEEQASGDQAVTGDKAQASYSIGYQFADNVKRQLEDSIDTDAFVAGVRDRLEGAEMRVSEADAERALGALMTSRQAAADAQALQNLEAGLEFLEENAQREGVTVLPSGLQYEVIEAGEGAKPGPTDTVTTHYEGRLIDGTVFDSSYERGEPASFPLNRVIPGWTEALQLMPTGAKWRLYVPAGLAYGERPAGQIPPNSTLIFDVELLDVEGSEAEEGAAEAESSPD
jgi:FKBP-type peptidyl-prolyl cis-trans isomerase FklB